MYAATWQMPQICVCARVHFTKNSIVSTVPLFLLLLHAKIDIKVFTFSYGVSPLFWYYEKLVLIKAERLCKNEYSNSLTRPELLPVAVFYGKTQLENVQTPPDRRPGGPQRWRRRRPYTACTTMWGESITPFAQRVVHAQHANCCLLACLSACLAGRAK